MTPPALVLCSCLIAVGLALAPALVSAPRDPGAAPATQGQPIEAVLVRPKQVDADELLDALQLRSPDRTLAVPPWPPEPSERFGLFAVATVDREGGELLVTVVLSDGRAYYRSLPVSDEGVPRLAASTVANLLAAIEEDELPPDEEDVPLPLEQEPEPVEPEPEPIEPAPEPIEPEPEFVEPPLAKPPMELELMLAGVAGASLGPPAPAGFGGGGVMLGLDLRLPAAAVVSLAVRSLWHQPADLTVSRTRISLGGGYAWRRGRFELRSVLGLDIEPWSVRRGGTRQPVGYPDGSERDLGLQLGGHLRLVPAFVIPLGATMILRVGPRLELAGSALSQASGVARLLVTDSAGQRTAVARVGGLELLGGVELGLGWSLPTRAPDSRR